MGSIWTLWVRAPETKCSPSSAVHALRTNRRRVVPAALVHIWACLLALFWGILVKSQTPAFQKRGPRAASPEASFRGALGVFPRLQSQDFSKAHTESFQKT